MGDQSSLKLKRLPNKKSARTKLLPLRVGDLAATSNVVCLADGAVVPLLDEGAVVRTDERARARRARGAAVAQDRPAAEGGGFNKAVLVGAIRNLM